MTSRTVAWAVAALLASLSLAGISVPALYAREAPAWLAQARGQDWFDLIVAAPWIAIAGALAPRSRRWRLVLAGAYAYVVYTLLIYAFAVHFNAMFLVYCATLGLASFALIADLGALASTAEPIAGRPARMAGGWLIAVGALFAALWLLEDIPAVLAGAPSRQLVETGLFTNPVHVIDLSFVLPAHVIAGVLLWLGDRRGAVYGPVVLAFGVVMAASIGAMLVFVGAYGVAGAMFTVAAATAGMLCNIVLRWTFQPAHGSGRMRSSAR